MGNLLASPSDFLCHLALSPSEMARAGLIEEMMNDALDSALDNEDIEEETEGEIEKVLLEVAGETLASLPAAKARPVSSGAALSCRLMHRNTIYSAVLCHQPFC